ncbi:MAG: signal transduction histidine kinase/CheY-like chemotaxis protein [Flavobacteriales bacterium]|jgi:signal transduction histidine kinase/CheY-like chemotaxis protein/HPt (histidine-containing phosphotransfer) domain-containing protein
MNESQHQTEPPPNEHTLTAALVAKERELEETKKHYRLLSEKFDYLLRERTEELEQARDAALASAKTKSYFLANISHEVRTPMNGILGMLQALKLYPNEEHRETLINAALNSGDQLVKVISNLLEFSRIESQGIQLKNTEFDLSETLKNTVYESRSNALAKGLDLILDLDPNLPTSSHGDPAKLSLVVDNLIENAIKFTTAGSVILHAKNSGHHAVEISIQDSGIGISQDKLQDIFKAFDQADNSSTRQYGGAGLGLSICATIIDAFESKINIVSEYQEGSTFSFILPQANINTTETEFIKAPASPLLDAHYFYIGKNKQCALTINKFLNCYDLKFEDYFDSISEFEAEEYEDEVLSLLFFDDSKPEETAINDLKYLKNTTKKLIVLGLCNDPSETGKHFDHILNRPFYFRDFLDICNRHKSDKATIPEEKEIQFSSIKTLAVDDNPMNLEVLKELLGEYDFDIETAGSGEKAIEQAQQTQYDLILMDIQMPGMDGLTATKEIRKINNHYAKIPIIAVTAHAFSEDRGISLNSSMDEHITKPIDLTSCIETITKVLQFKLSNVSIHEKTEHPSHNSDDNNWNSMISKDRSKTEFIPPNISGFDLQAALDRLRGKWDLLQSLIISFCNANLDAYTRMTNFIDSDNHEEAQRLAHQLKGSGANLGAVELSQISAKIENGYKNGNHANTEHLMELKLAIENIHRAKEILGKLEKNIDKPSNTKTIQKLDDTKVKSLLQNISSNLHSDLAVVQTLLDTLKIESENTPHQQIITCLCDHFNRLQLSEIEKTITTYLDTGEFT